MHPTFDPAGLRGPEKDGYMEKLPSPETTRSHSVLPLALQPEAVTASTVPVRTRLEE